MKYLKILGLAATATVLVAILSAGSASASVLCSTTVSPCPAGQKWPVNTVVDFSLSGGWTFLNETDTSEVDKCSASTMEWQITNAGGAETVTGKFSEPVATTGLTWSGCTFPTKTRSAPKWKIQKIAGTSNGTVTSDAIIIEVEINTVLFGVCIYGIEPTTELGSITEGKPATYHANAVLKKIKGEVCPETIIWTGTYTLTSPSSTTLSVSES